MRLSEAIRIGAMMRGQCHDYLVTPGGGETCVFGAAAEAIKGLAWLRVSDWLYESTAENQSWLWQEIAAMFPETFADAKHPVTGEVAPIYDIIVWLNDDYRWTRNDIADWLDQVLPPLSENAEVQCELSAIGRPA